MTTKSCLNRYLKSASGCLDKGRQHILSGNAFADGGFGV